jgi:hypothetical protein
MRFTHDGIPVKPTDVTADTVCAVLNTRFVDRPFTATVPVPAGKVTVPDATADGDSVVVPEEEPFRAKLESVANPEVAGSAVVHADPLYTSSAAVVVL